MVAMDSLKFHPGPPCPTILRPAGKPPLKRPYGCFRDDPPAGQAACSYLLPLWTPDGPRHTSMGVIVWPSAIRQLRFHGSMVRFFMPCMHFSYNDFFALQLRGKKNHFQSFTVFPQMGTIRRISSFWHLRYGTLAGKIK
jgi:hypothetical protein